MRPINQTRNFCTCLHGYTLPMYAIYGNVYKTLYYVTDFNAHNDNGKTYYRIHVYCPNKKPGRPGSWKITDTRTYGAIFLKIRDFMKSGDFINKPVVRCEHRTFFAQEMAIAAAKAEADINRPYEQIAREACPERKIPIPQYRASAYQLNAAEYYNSAPCVYADKGADMTVMNTPKLFNRDGIRHPFNKYRPEDTRTKINPRSMREPLPDNSGLIFNADNSNSELKTQGWLKNISVKRVHM